MAAWHAVAVSISDYLQRYRRALVHPFALLVGQVVTFFVISLYVKFVELRLTPAYAGPWIGSGRTLLNIRDSLLFSAHEIAFFAALLIALATVRYCMPSAGLVARASAWTIGLAALPFLSLVEVLGLGHFALFLTPIGPADIRMVTWSSHLVTAGHVVQSPGVALGLLAIGIGYYGVPPVLWLGHQRLARLLKTRALAGTVAAAALLLVLPTPQVDDVLLVPHPVLWLAFGSRPAGIMYPTVAVAAESPATITRGSLTVSERPTNVLIVVLESTRASSVALYTPNASAGRELVALRDDIVVFDQVYAPVPTSAHALFSILYGVYPYLGPFWMTADKAVVAESMAERFARDGYATHLYATADLNFDDVRSFATRGFERVRDPNDWPGQEDYALLEWGRDDRLLFEEIKSFLATDRTRPFFLLAFTSNQHHPYAAEQLLGGPPAASPREAYEQLVAHDLRQLAELYRWMKVRGVADSTLLLVVGDHGEAFGEHPGNFGHAAFIYEENVHVPCFILHPRRLGLPRHIPQLGSQVDLRATIDDILGLPETQPTDGISLLRRSPERAVAYFTENGISHFGIRDQGFSYISTPHGAERLYDRRRDPQEGHDLGAQYPAVTAQYRDRLQRWEAQHQLSLARVLR